jgi:hypothetical protein
MGLWMTGLFGRAAGYRFEKGERGNPTNIVKNLTKRSFIPLEILWTFRNSSINIFMYLHGWWWSVFV